MRGLQEIVPIQDVFASGLGAIERMDGGVYRLWFYVMQNDEGNAPEKLVVAKIITPGASISDAIMKLVAAINDSTAAMISLVPDILN